MRRQILTLIFTTLGCMSLACSREDLGDLKTKYLRKKPPAESPANEKPAEVTNSTKVVTKNIDNSGASMQVKDVLLLRSSVEGCMGSGMLAVTADMLLPTDLTTNPPKLPDARLRFLLATQYKVGDDVIDKESGNLVDVATGARTNIAADSLTDTYLRSLETIGNVVAHNCSTTNPNCQCGSKDEALEMMAKCLPGLNPNTVEMNDSAALLGAICGENVEGMRKAISSLISSYAFAVAR